MLKNVDVTSKGILGKKKLREIPGETPEESPEKALEGKA